MTEAKECEGSPGSYMRHRRKGEAPCARCKRAWALYYREYRRKK